MSENVRPRWDISRVTSDTLDLIEDEERRCLDLSVLQCSILRQMTFPWAKFRTRLVEEHPDYWVVVDQPQAYVEALEELEVLLSGAYDGPKEGCPMGEVFVDRGDPSVNDFTIANGLLVADSQWNIVNLDQIIPVGSTYVLLRVELTSATVGKYIILREAGNSNIPNSVILRAQAANVDNDGSALVAVGGLRYVAYVLQTGVAAATVTVRGWWVPA
jgi:hypothetical protein